MEAMKTMGSHEKYLLLAGTRRSDNVAPHKCEILEQTSHRKATAGKVLIEGMNEVLCLKEQGNEPSLLGLFFSKCETLLEEENEFPVKRTRFSDDLGECLFFPHVAEQ